MRKDLTPCIGFAVFAHQNGPGRTPFSVKDTEDGFEVPARLGLAGEQQTQRQAGLRKDAMSGLGPERELVLISKMDPQELDTLLSETKVHYERRANDALASQ